MAKTDNMKASRVNKKWSERDTVKFVELYEMEEVLWNVRLRDYKNKDARNAAIQRIIENFNFLTPENVNKKINNIRTTYCQEKAKIKNSLTTGSGADEVYVPSLPWFEIADRFLSNIVKSRKTFNNLTDSESDRTYIVSPNIPENPSLEVPTLNTTEELFPSDYPTQSSEIARVASPLSASSSQDSFAKPQNMKTKKRTNVDRIEKSIDKLQTIKDQVLSNKKETEDEFSYFGKNIASQLRSIPIIDALDLQSEIMVLVKRKRQSILKQQEREMFTATPEDYTIQIPEHMFNDILSQQNQESPSILITQVPAASQPQNNAINEADRDSSSTATGDYTIQISERMFNNLLTQRNQEGSQSIYVSTSPQSNDPVEEAIKNMGGFGDET